MRTTQLKSILKAALAGSAVLALAGCISLGSSPPSKTTIVVPQGTTSVCSDGSAPPC